MVGLRSKQNQTPIKHDKEIFNSSWNRPRKETRLQVLVYARSCMLIVHVQPAVGGNVEEFQTNNISAYHYLFIYLFIYLVIYLFIRQKGRYSPKIECTNTAIPCM